MGKIIFNALFLAWMAFVLLFLLANALPKRKHYEWHEQDGK